MEASLRGSSVGAITTGILLITRARQLGLRAAVEVVGDPDDAIEMPGPALVYAPVLASCGIGREAGHGATVVVPGPPGAPLHISLEPHGLGGWFTIDRLGGGSTEATRAFVRMSQDPRIPVRHLAKQLRGALALLGVAAEPAVIDVLCGAPAAPLTRLSIALRAGRAMSGGRGQPVTRFLAGSSPAVRDPIDPETSADDVLSAVARGELDWILDRLSPALRDPLEEWLEGAARAAREDRGRDAALARDLVEIASHVVQLPAPSILPPLSASEDAVAVALGAGLSADGRVNATRQLADMYRFLGGRFTTDDRHAIDLGGEPPPSDPMLRWQWFCTEAYNARQRARGLWRDLLDPPQ
jgi:hypothetical protein